MTILSNILQPLLGGVLIGCASWLLLSSVGRIAGISGILSSLLFSKPSERAWRVAFLIGLIVGGYVTASWFTAPLMPSRAVSLLLVAGLLVGFGTVWGSGCTSGHGVCGLGRRSVRSLVATLTFMTTGFLTVFIVGLIN